MLCYVNDIIVPTAHSEAQRPIVNGQIDLHKQLLFVQGETHSVDTAR